MSHQHVINRRRFLQITAAATISAKFPFVMASQSGSGRLRIRKKYDLRNIDPADYFWEDEVITRNILAPLIRHQGDRSDRPWVEHTVKSLNQHDELRIEFNLRAGEKWSDGAELTSEDVKYSFERIAGITDPDLNARHKAVWKNLKNVQMLDKYSGVIVLKQKTPGLVTSVLAFGPGCVVSHEKVKSMPEKRFKTEPGVTTGRYFISNHIRGQYIDLDEDPHWYGDKPNVKKARFVIIEDDDVARSAYEKGEIDVYKITPTVLHSTRIALKHGDQFTFAPAQSVSYLGINTQRGPLSNESLRRAIHHAIDADEIIRKMFSGLKSWTGAENGFPVRATGIVPVDVLGSRKSNFFKYNPDRVQSALKEGGAPSGFETTLHVWKRNDNALFTIAEMIVKQLVRFGIKIRLIPLNPWLARQQGQDVNMFISRARSIYPDPRWFTRWFLSSEKQLNLTEFSNKEYDELYEKADREKDVARRANLYQEMQNIVENTGAAMFLVDERVLWLFRKVRPVFTPYGELGDLGDFRQA